MENDWIDQYGDTEDINEKYLLLKQEMSRLRADAGGSDRFDPDDVAEDVSRLNDGIEGHLIVFAANDFGLPVAFRPESLNFEHQDAVRGAILENKYDEHEDLDVLRRELLDAHPSVHKAIVAEYTEESIRYHLPEGSTPSTNFLTVREMVGLVDYTTNSSQKEGLSKVY